MPLSLVGSEMCIRDRPEAKRNKYKKAIAVLKDGKTGKQPVPPPSLTPSRAAEEQPATKPPSESGLAFLASMGYSVDRCEHALRSAQVRCRDCHLFRFCTLGARFNVRALHCILFFTRKITRNACDPPTREILKLRSNCFSLVRIARTQVLHSQKRCWAAV